MLFICQHFAGTGKELMAQLSSNFKIPMDSQRVRGRAAERCLDILAKSETDTLEGIKKLVKTFGDA